MHEKLAAKELDALAKKHSYIKINLPEDIQSYRQGNGEGVWAVVLEPEDLAKYKNNASSGQFIAVACSDSFYFPGEIVCGSKVLCEFRGEKRPMAVWDDLQGTKDAADNRNKIMKKVFEKDCGGECEHE